MRARSAILWIIGAGLVCAFAVLLGVPYFRSYQRRPLEIRGAVIKQDDDPIKQSPIMDVEISEADGLRDEQHEIQFHRIFYAPSWTAVSGGTNR